MHHLSHQNLDRNPKNLSILQFKPRQVLLLERKNTNTMKKCNTVDSEIDQYTKLCREVGHFLWKSKFYKTLAKFQSELKIDKVDNWEKCSSYTEEELLKCLDTFNKKSGHFEGDNDQDGVSKKDGASDCISSLETVTEKKKKKRKSESETKIEVSAPNILDDVIASSLVPEPTVESKNKKKKAVADSDKPIAVESEALASENGTVDVPLPDKSGKKSKNKKKKKSKSDGESLVENADDVATNTEIKESKKRKRLVTEVKETEPANVISNECKRRKTEGMEESKVENQLTKINAAIGSNGLAAKEINEEDTKVNFNESEEKSTKQKSLKKQNGGSAEPKSVNAFQRVKIDKVVFTDDRLQDNSYWAKDGAEVGYGAKAQEVLGQVRGRDFRHEKTKKKRGSYRGGTIDFVSHSVKFNYSDEE